MSHTGQQQTFRDVCVTSALPLKADIRPRGILDGLVAEFGTVEKAIEAVKSGMVSFDED
jgi:hypothetical protein